MFASLTVMAVVLLAPIHVNAQDASQVKWELYGKLAHLRHHQFLLTDTSTALSERASSLQSAARIALKEWDDYQPQVLAHLAQLAKVDKAIEEWNARCKGITDKNKNFVSCRNKRADLIAWRSAVDAKSEKLTVPVVAKEKEMASITVELKEVETQMNKKTAELSSVKIAMQTTQQMIDKIRTDERQSNSPSINAVHVTHVLECPMWLAAPPKLPFYGMQISKWAPKRIFTRDCTVTKNGQTSQYKEGEETGTLLDGRIEWEGPDEAGEDEVTIGGKG